LGGNSLSDLLVFGKRAGEFAAKFAGDHGNGVIDNTQINEAARRSLEPFERGEAKDAEGPYKIQLELQEMMQALVGIVRTEDEMQRALEGIERLWQRASTVAVTGNREYNPGWHTALDLTNLLTVSEAVTRSAIERKESRGAQFRDDYPAKDEGFGKINIAVKRDSDGTMKVVRESIPEMPADLRQVIQEMG
jgi:succinate dehydrogenase / fumarate reductase flavoprotein subunit